MNIANTILIILMVSTAIAQIYGSRLETHPCRWLKLSSGISIFISVFIVIVFEIITEQEYGYLSALFLCVFNTLMCAVVKIYDLHRIKRTKGCKYE